MPPWTPGHPPADYVVGHVTAVLPDRMMDDARVVVRDGRVAEVSPHPPGVCCDVDGRGAALIPGLVDVHSDSLVKDLRPRLGQALDPVFALAAAGSRLRGVGVTTAYHGLAFQERSIVGLPIGSPSAQELSDVLAEPPDGQLDHRVLHRLDVRCEHGRALLEKQLAAHDKSAGLPVVSCEDHTPGLGQFADPATMRRWLVSDEGMTESQAAAHVADLRSDRETRVDVRAATLAWLGELASAKRMLLFGHDVATPEEAHELANRGCAVAEFPTTLAAARAARELGLLIVAGAPNVVRGGSHAGNVSAAQLVATER